MLIAREMAESGIGSEFMKKTYKDIDDFHHYSHIPHAGEILDMRKAFKQFMMDKGKPVKFTKSNLKQFHQTLMYKSIMLKYESRDFGNKDILDVSDDDN